jgi:hypothetical protein
MRPEGFVGHDEKQTDAHAMARCQVWLMRPIIYGGSVLGRARDPLKWFSSDTPAPCLVPPRPTPRLGVAGFDRGRVLSGMTPPPLPTYEWPPATRVSFLNALFDWRVPGTGDQFPNKLKDILV